MPPRPNPILSHRHLTFIIEGHRVEGLSSSDNPISFETIKTTVHEWGTDGTLYVADSGRLGSLCTIQLLPTSKTALWALQRLAERHNGKSRILTGDYSDNEKGFSLHCTGGVLEDCQPSIEPGRDFEFTIRFEKVIPEVAGAKFPNAPTSTQ